MSRFAADRRVLYVEEPVSTNHGAYLTHSVDSSGVQVVVPHIAQSKDQTTVLRGLIDQMLEELNIRSYALWYYTPIALEWTSHLAPTAIVYDCMDELSAFKGAPPGLRQCESELLKKADVVFTGGHTLFEAKRNQHDHVYPFPSSIDVSHFAKARTSCSDFDDQARIPHPRLGYAGVIDERMDLDLIGAVAKARPDWHFVLLGPVVKIDKSSLPDHSNIHYLGMKAYDQLPAYLGGWDVGLLPFARNESTRYISPTKTPEYLTAGLPVVSTSIRDVVRPYGAAGVVHIADEPARFIAAIEKALTEDASKRLAKVDRLLANNCWSRTWGRMNELLEDATRRRTTMTSFCAIAASGSFLQERARLE